MRVPPLPDHHSCEKVDEGALMSSDRYSHGSCEDFEELYDDDSESLNEYDENGEEYQVYRDDDYVVYTDTEYESEINDDSDEAYIINPPKNHNYVVYSSTESENESGSETSTPSKREGKGVKIISQNSSKFRKKNRNFFSCRTVFSTSRSEEDGCYSKTKARPKVPLDELNLCMFTALGKFKFPKSSRMIKLSKFLFLKWSNRKNSGSKVFDWKSISTLNNTLSEKRISIDEFKKYHSGFQGVKERDLIEFERFFGVSVRMYTKRFLTDSVDEDGSKIGRPYTILKRRTNLNSGDVMNLHLDEYTDHVDLIQSMEQYSDSYICKRCQLTFNRHSSLIRHENGCTSITKKRYKGGPFLPQKTIFEKLDAHDIAVPEELRYNDFLTVFDLETYLKRVRHQKGPYTDHHIVYSYGCASNVPGFGDEPKVAISDDPLELMRDLVHHFCDISKTILEINTEKYKTIIQEIDDKIKVCEDFNKQVDVKYLTNLKQSLLNFMTQCTVVTFNGSRFDLPASRCYLHQILQEMGNYGATPTKFYQENEHYRCRKPFSVERGTQILCFSTNKFKILDICQFIAPGCNYDKYLKTWAPKGTTLSKLHFPHGMMRGGIDVLSNRKFPSHNDFYSHLKQKNSFDSYDEYMKVKSEWVGDDGEYFKNDMTLRDFLIAYQIGDVAPFLQCLEEHSKLYREELELDLLAHNYTLASLSWRWAFKDEDAVFYNFPESYGSIHDEILNGRTGGCTVVMKREAKLNDVIPERGTTIPNAEGRKVKLIKSLDCNQLYPFQFLKPQFSGPPVYREYPDFSPEKISHYVKGASVASYEWLQFLKEKRGYKKMITKFNSREVRVTNRNLPVDGYVPIDEDNGVTEPHIFQFFGCYFHGCNKKGCKFSYMNKMKYVTDPNERAEIVVESQNKYSSTLEKINYMESQGIRLEHIWECEWDEQKRSSPSEKLRDIVRRLGLYPESGYSKSKMTENEVKESMKNGSFFGIAKVDISVPDKLRDYFSIFPPLFSKCDVSIDDVGPYTEKMCREQGDLKTPREQLITCFEVEGSILSSGLINWYLNKGMVISHVHWTLEYKPELAFNTKVERAADLRRLADSDPRLSNLQQSMKIQTNSIYGKSGERVDKRIRNVIATSKNAGRYIKNPRFKHITPILPPEFAIEVSKKKGVDEEGDISNDDEVLEYVVNDSMFPTEGAMECETNLFKVEMLPMCVTHKLPIQISLFTLCESKMTLLSFIYDVIDHYLIPNSFEILYSDTDNVVLSLSCDHSIDEIIKPDLAKEFFEKKHLFFPAESCEKCRERYVYTKVNKLEWEMEECCIAQNRKGSRQPGLWKREAIATHCVFLAPKTYCMYDAHSKESKTSTKGLNKSQNSHELENFLRVLHGTVPRDGGYNHGMKRSKSGSVLAYSQYRSALSSIYCKRQVLDDKISTRPLPQSLNCKLMKISPKN